MENPLRKSLKWYKKLTYDLILNVAMVNASVLYKSVTNKFITIIDFRKEILKSFMSKPSILRVTYLQYFCEFHYKTHPK